MPESIGSGVAIPFGPVVAVGGAGVVVVVGGGVDWEVDVGGAPKFSSTQ
jgi:hypothetical protein